MIVFNSTKFEVCEHDRDCNLFVEEPSLAASFGDLLAIYGRGFQFNFRYNHKNMIDVSASMVSDRDNTLMRNSVHNVTVTDLRAFADQIISFCDECEKAHEHSKTKS